MGRRSSAKPRRRLRPARARQQWTLSDDWRAWVIENLARGQAPLSILAALRQRGVPAGLARRELIALLGQPGHALCRRQQQRIRNLELLLRVRRDTWRARPGAGSIERVAGLDVGGFYSLFYDTNTPVVLSDVADRWPALQRWSLDALRRRFGDVPIEIMAGRDGDPHCDRNFEQHKTATRLGALIDRITAARTPSNDFYLVAHNRAFEDTALSGMLDDITLPDILDPARLEGGCSLWLGPAGTMTPLHHDKNNILFCQIVGHKTVRLIAPHESALLSGLRAIYSPFDPRDFDTHKHPELVGVCVEEVTLSPGEALFIPIGWWHHVVAHSASVSISFTCFRQPNCYRWYVPGTL